MAIERNVLLNAQRADAAPVRRVVTVYSITRDYSDPMLPQSGHVSREVVERQGGEETVVSSRKVQTLRFDNRQSGGRRTRPLR